VLKIKLFTAFIIGLFFSLVVKTDAQAATYYLDNIGGSDSNAGTSEATPWQTLDPLRATALQPGDTVLFKDGGIWDTGYAGGSLSTNVGLHIDKSGTAASPISFGSYGNGDNPVFVNSYSDIPYTRAVTISGDYVVMAGFHIKDAKEAGVYVTDASSNVTLDSLDVSNTAHGVVLAGNTTTLKHSRIHDTTMFINTNDNGDNDSGAVGVMVIGSNNQITNNTLENNLQPSFDYGTDGSAIEFFADGTTSQNNTVAYNFINDNDAVTEIGGSNNPTFDGIAFRFNVMSNNSRVMVMHLASGAFGATVSNVTFTHNTVYENKNEWQGTAALRPNGPLFWFASQPSTSTLGVKNSIFSLTGFSSFANYDTFSHDHNLYNMVGGGTLYSLSTGEITGDPLLTTTNVAPFYILQAGSPAIDVGVTTPLTPDFIGTAIPQGSSADIGAIEYTPLGCSTTPDVNNDVNVNLIDYSLLASKFFQTVGISAVDLNCDGSVNLVDYSLLVQAFSLL
jgi:hypothetical protein